MDSASPSPPSPCPPPSHVTSDPTSYEMEHPVRATSFTLHADDLGIETRSGVYDISGLGVGICDQEDRTSSNGSPFSKMEPLRSAPLLLQEETTRSFSCSLDNRRDATPENCLLASQKLPPLDEGLECENGSDNTSPKMVDDDVTVIKRLAKQAAVPERRQEAPAEDRQTQHRDETSVSLWPAEEASGCSTSWQDELEAARLAAYPPHPNPQPLPPGKSFHVFFSYCWRDAAWVRRMVDVLEREHGLRCCYHERDFKPGARVIENINLHIESSVKTALVVSPAFLESEWCSYEAEVVMHLSVEQRRRLLVPILLQQCQLPGALRPLTYIDATVPAFLDRVIAAIFDQDDCVHDRPLPFGRTDFFFNPNFYNLDHLCDVTSKLTCLRGETILSPYVPEVLMNRGLTMTLKEHREIVAKLTKASYILCSVKCDFCLFSLVSVVFAAVCLAMLMVGIAMLPSGVASTDFAIGLGSMCGFVALPLIVTISCVGITFRRRTRLRKSLTEVNRIYFRHQLMAGLVVNLGCCRRFALQLKVHYFNPRPCLDHLACLLLSPHSPPTQGSEGTDDQLLDAGTSLQINEGERSSLGRGQSSTIASDQIEGDDVALLNPCTETGETEESSPEQSRALELLLKYSGDYMRDYIEGKLPVCEPSRHVRQVSCLCQYVEDRIAVV